MGVIRFPEQPKVDLEKDERSIAEMYPDGLNEIIVEFLTAVYYIFATDEIDKIINNTEGEELENLIELDKYFSSLEKVSDLPHWIMLVEVFEKMAPCLFPNILSIMMLHHNGVYKGEELERKMSFHVDPNTGAGTYLE